MYKKFYGLQDKPFNLTPDTKFLYVSSHHKDAITFLKKEFKKSKIRLLALTGEIGAGKTMLLRNFVKNVPSTYEVIQVLYPSRESMHLLQMILLNMGVKSIHDDMDSLKQALRERLIQMKSMRKQPLLVIDEAQILGLDAISEVVAMSGMKEGRKSLLKVVLVGLSDLKRNLLKLGPLNTVESHHLAYLSRDEIPKYIQHRFSVAGRPVCTIFPSNVIDEISRISTGTPRVINSICDTALAKGYFAHKKIIDLPFFKDVVERYLLSLQSDVDPKQTLPRTDEIPGDSIAASHKRLPNPEILKKAANEPKSIKREGPYTQWESTNAHDLPLKVVVLEKNVRMRVHLENEFRKWDYSFDMTSGFEELFTGLEKSRDKEMKILIADSDFFFVKGVDDATGMSALDRIQTVYAYIPVIMTSTLPLTAIRTKLFQRGLPLLLKKPNLNRLDVSEITARFNMYFEELQNSLANIHAQFEIFYKESLKWDGGEAKYNDRFTSLQRETVKEIKETRE